MDDASSPKLVIGGMGLWLVMYSIGTPLVWKSPGKQKLLARVPDREPADRKGQLSRS